MSKDVSYKNFWDGGVTTYHADGSKSVTYKNMTDPGYTTYHTDGSHSRTYKNITDSGYTTYQADGSRSRTYKNVFIPGVTTYHEDGSRSITQKNLLDNGYSTYDNSIPPAYFSSAQPGHRAASTAYPGRMYPLSTAPVHRNQADKWAITSWAIYLPLTLYILATFFIRALPTGFLPMVTCLTAALFFHAYYQSAAGSPGLGTKALLFFIQTLLYLLQIGVRLIARFASISGREANIYIFLGPALFLAAQVLATWLGRRRHRKWLAHKGH